MSQLFAPTHTPSRNGQHAAPFDYTPVLDALFYADIFDYPLTLAEVHRYATATADEAQISAMLDAAIVAGEVAQAGSYYFLSGRDYLVDVRGKRAQLCEPKWAAARRHCHAVAALPFVRAIMVTGSLAMSNGDEYADIDLLIVARRGRVWLCRALCGLYARFFSNHENHLCINYLIGDDALSFERRTMFTAHEFSQMIPMYGAKLYHAMHHHNAWVAEYLPNTTPRSSIEAARLDQRRSPLKRLAEAVLREPLGAMLERRERQRKLGSLARRHETGLDAAYTANTFKMHPVSRDAAVMYGYNLRRRAHLADRAGDRLTSTNAQRDR